MKTKHKQVRYKTSNDSRGYFVKLHTDTEDNTIILARLETIESGILYQFKQVNIQNNKILYTEQFDSYED